MIDPRDMTLGLEYLEMLHQMTGVEYAVLRVPTGYQVTLDGICLTASRLDDAATEETREYLRWQKVQVPQEASLCTSSKLTPADYPSRQVGAWCPARDRNIRFSPCRLTRRQCYEEDLLF